MIHWTMYIAEGGNELRAEGFGGVVLGALVAVSCD